MILGVRPVTFNLASPGWRHEVTYSVDIRQEHEGYWAQVEQLPGCFATGLSPQELREALVEALELYLSTPECRVKVLESGQW